MKKKIEIIIKCDNGEQAADALEEIALQLRGAGFDKAPNDIRECEDANEVPYGFLYDVRDNDDNTDIYGNAIEDDQC